MQTLAIRPVADATATRHLGRRLIAAYAGRHPALYVESVVAAAHRRFATARVQGFFAIFVERLAREILDAPAAPMPGDVAAVENRSARHEPVWPCEPTFTGPLPRPW